MKLAPLLLCLQAQEVTETPYETVVINAESNFEACGVADLDVVLPGKSGPTS